MEFIFHNSAGCLGNDKGKVEGMHKMYCLLYFKGNTVLILLKVIFGDWKVQIWIFMAEMDFQVQHYKYQGDSNGVCITILLEATYYM